MYDFSLEIKLNYWPKEINKTQQCNLFLYGPNRRELKPLELWVLIKLSSMIEYLTHLF